MGLYTLVYVLFVLMLVKARLLHSLSSTGHDNEPGSNEVDTTSTDLIFKDFWNKHNNGSCPYGQILQQEGTLCCLPVSCGPGFEVVPCSMNGKEDTCRKCASDFLQPNNVSSLFMSIATCFRKKNKGIYCPLDDMKPAQTTMSVNFPLHCACKNEECYYEYQTSGVCSRADHVCQEGFQMNKTGSCVPCEWYSYKNTVGCEPCIQNDTLLRQGKPDGIYVPPSWTTTTPKVPDSSDNYRGANEQLNTLPGPDTTKLDESRDKQEGSSLSSSIVFIICGTVVFIVVVAAFVYRSRNTGRFFRETERPLLTNQSSAPSTPINGNGFQSGILQTTGLVPERMQQANGHHLSHGIIQGNAELPQNNGDMQVNGQVTQNDTILPAASLTYENDVPQNQSNIDNLAPLETTACVNEFSSESALRDGIIAVNGRAPTNYVSIHGNKFENCRIYLPNKKTALKEMSGSFGMDSSLESEGNHPLNGHATTASTIIQPGRREGYLINGNDGSHDEGGATGNCRPEYSRPVTDHVHQHEAAVHHEDVAMMTLNKPEYPFKTDIEADSDLAEMVGNKEGTQEDIDKPKTDGAQPPPQTRQVAKVAPMIQSTRLQSVRHVSGYLSGANESEESASNSSSTLQTDYAFVQLNTGVLENDIADCRDFSADAVVPSSNESRRLNDGTADRVSEETFRKTPNLPAVVRLVPPICRRECPDGDSTRDVNESEVVMNENVTPKTVADDQTSVKEYAGWGHHKKEVLATSDSKTDLEKEKKTLIGSDKSSKSIDETEAESEHDTERKFISESCNSEEDLAKLKNAREKLSDDQNDIVCDKSDVKCISDTVDDTCITDNGSLQMSESVDHLLMTELTDNSQLKSELSELTDNSDRHSSETVEDSSVEIDGIFTSDDVSGVSNVEEQTDLQLDNSEVSGVLTSVNSEPSFELGEDIDIDAIHQENERIKEITCRGETSNGLNSVLSGYKGIVSN